MNFGSLSSDSLVGYGAYRKFDFLTQTSELSFAFPNALSNVSMRCDQPALIRLGGATSDQVALEPGEWRAFPGLSISLLYYLSPDWRCRFGRLEILGVY